MSIPVLMKYWRENGGWGEGGRRWGWTQNGIEIKERRLFKMEGIIKDLLGALSSTYTYTINEVQSRKYLKRMWFEFAVIWLTFSGSKSSTPSRDRLSRKNSVSCWERAIKIKVVFNKGQDIDIYTGCSSNIVIFSKNSLKFATSPSPTLGCYWLCKNYTLLMPRKRSKQPVDAGRTFTFILIIWGYKRWLIEILCI